MKVKPIFIVRVPDSYDDELVYSMGKVLNEKIKDYHYLVILQDIKSIEFEVFYEKDFNEVKYEELKEIVTNMTKE